MDVATSPISDDMLRLSVSSPGSMADGPPTGGALVSPLGPMTLDTRGGMSPLDATAARTPERGGGLHGPGGDYRMKTFTCE